MEFLCWTYSFSAEAGHVLRRVNPWRFIVGPAIAGPAEHHSTLIPWVAPTAAGKPMVIHKLDPPSGSSISKIEINAFGKRSKFYLSMRSAAADQTLTNPRRNLGKVGKPEDKESQPAKAG